MYRFEKCSMPGWTRYVETKEELIEQLREEMCTDCLEQAEPLYKGKLYQCREISPFLATPCGCEYWVEDEEGNYC